MRIGIFGGDTASRTIDEVVEHAQLAEAAGFSSYTLPQIFALDAMGVLSVVGREVPRIMLGTGVVPTYGRHPLTMAQQALTVQMASGGRFVLGIGLSHQMVIEGMFGLSFEHPLRHMREYLSVLMPLLHDRTVAYSGETISTSASIGVSDLPAPPVVIAALGPKMLELAGRVANGTMTWMTGHMTLASYTVPTITRAAEAEGRPAPEVIASLPICLTDDTDGARARAAADFSVYGFLPSYRAMLDREGAATPGDVAIVGDEAAVEKSLGELRDGGVTEFVAAVFGTRAERERTWAFLQAAL